MVYEILSQREIDELLLCGNKKLRRRRKRESWREECQYERYADDWERESDD